MRREDTAQELSALGGKSGAAEISGAGEAPHSAGGGAPASADPVSAGGSVALAVEPSTGAAMVLGPALPWRMLLADMPCTYLLALHPCTIRGRTRRSASVHACGRA